MIFLAAAVVIALGVEASLLQDTPCNLPDIDLDEEIDKLLEKLPKAFIPMGSRGFDNLLHGLEIGHLNVTGMNKIQRYGPVIPYCRKGTNMVQVDLINIGAVDLTVLWRICSGQEGTATLHAEYSRFTAHFGVGMKGSRGMFLGLSSEIPVFPVMTYIVEFILKGFGQGGKSLSFVMNKLFPTMFQSLWVNAFSQNFDSAMRSVLRGDNEVL